MRQLGLLPDIPGAEAAYFIRHISNERQYGLLPDPHIHGLFLSHAHHDHDGNIPFLSPRIPLFATAEALCFYEQKNIQSWVGKDSQPKNRYKNNEHWRKRLSGHYALDEARPVTFLDKTRVTPIRVDHSIPGACGFLVETSDGKQVALTGDFRMHGPVDLAFEREAMVVIGVSGNNIERIFVSPSKV